MSAARRLRYSAGKDAQTRFHEEWLGLAQPIEGLVFSVPVLADAQIAPDAAAEVSARFRAAVRGPSPEHPLALPELRAFFASFLGYRDPRMLTPREKLPDDLCFYAEEGRQGIRPSFAVERGPFDAQDPDPLGGFGSPSSAEAGPEYEPDVSPHLMLAWDLRDDGGPDLDLDEPEEVTGHWRCSPTAKLERLLRHTGIPIGLLANRQQLRLIYAPAREATSHLSFRVADMAEPAGRPLLAAFELLFGAQRSYGAAPEHTLEGLLRESRRRQADVTKDLAAQVFEAVELLLEGFARAALREGGARAEWLEQALAAPNDHLYRGVLSVVLRLVFLLYAEDKDLLPVKQGLYARSYSVKGLYDELLEDSGRHPESMHHRFGAYGRLLALFRMVYQGVQHGTLRPPAHRGELFDPSSFPFLEGGLPGSTAAIQRADARADVRPPAVDDGAIYAVLRRLIRFQGQRLSYRTLDVEQIGSVYESLMGYHVQRVQSPAVRLGSNHVWVETRSLRAMAPVDRKKLLKQDCKLDAEQQKRVEEALATHRDATAFTEALAVLAPGRAHERERHRATPGTLVLQPGDERRRSGTQYTPSSLTRPVVTRTLEPILAALGPAPSEEQILALRICDLAMGSGAFLVEVCRRLAAQLEAVWIREGRAAALAEQHASTELHAMRLVAGRCLYGVDKNPAAVELAKLSLWLVTMSEELPFTFLDHALRHGDALVGLDLEQINAFHWKPAPQRELFATVLHEALEESLEHYSALLQLASQDDAVTQEEKRRLLIYANQAKDRIRLVADVCVGAFFSADSDRPREAELERRLPLATRFMSGDESVEPELRRLSQEIRDRHAPFHWWLEFPEIFHLGRRDPLKRAAAAGLACLDAIVGNPPFGGKNTITEAHGSKYLDWLKIIHPGAHGNADLSAHFFRRAARLLGTQGSFGLIATKTIAQGDTRTTGLTPLVESGWVIYDATTLMAWPGEAKVTVSVVHAAVGMDEHLPEQRLDGVPLRAISSRLRSGPERAEAQPLAENADCAYVGIYVLGMGFTLSPAEHNELVKRKKRNSERIFPYLGGEEVNTSPTQNFDRYVINFGQMTLEEAERWPDLIQIVREKVKPERDQNNRENYRKRWWQFGEARPGMLKAIEPLERFLVTACGASKHLLFSFQAAGRVCAHTLYVFPIDGYSGFATLQSRIHEPWARLLSSSMKTDLRYTASDCFETFPFPQSDPRATLAPLERTGKELYEARTAFMLANSQGLTKTYNALKDPGNRDPRVERLRQLHEAMDRAVLDAYGWSDLSVPPFCPTNEPEQAALVAFQDEVIDRLYTLNAERARKKGHTAAGVPPKRTPRTRKGVQRKASGGDAAPSQRSTARTKHTTAKSPKRRAPAKSSRKRRS